MNIANERNVNLDQVGPQQQDVPETCVTGARVVYREPKSSLTERRKDRGDPRVVGDGRVFGHLNHDAAQLDAFQHLRETGRSQRCWGDVQCEECLVRHERQEPQGRTGGR